MATQNAPADRSNFYFFELIGKGAVHPGDGHPAAK